MNPFKDYLHRSILKIMVNANKMDKVQERLHYIQFPILGTPKSLKSPSSNYLKSFLLPISPPLNYLYELLA